MKGLEWCELKTKTMFEMIDKTLFSVCTDESRFHLYGALLMSSPKGFSLASTDGHRLSVVERPSLCDLDFSKGVIIPRKGLNLILSTFKKSERVEIAQRGSNLYLRDREVTLAVKLIDAEFPDYKQVIPEPKTLTRKAIIWRQTLVDALKAALPLLGKNSKMGLGVHLTLTPGALKVSAEGFSESLPVEYKGSEWMTGVSAKYALELLNQIGSAEIAFEAPEHSVMAGYEPTPGPMMFKGLDDPDYLGVIMPVRF